MIGWYRICSSRSRRERRSSRVRRLDGGSQLLRQTRLPEPAGLQCVHPEVRELVDLAFRRAQLIYRKAAELGHTILVPAHDREPKCGESLTRVGIGRGPIAGRRRSLWLIRHTTVDPPLHVLDRFAKCGIDHPWRFFELVDCFDNACPESRRVLLGVGTGGPMRLDSRCHGAVGVQDDMRTPALDLRYPSTVILPS